MGQTKRLYGQMELDELLTHFFNHNESDEDYQYEMWKQKQMDNYHQELMEREAYELHFQDKYANG
jgi:hypothetical protein